MCCPRRICRIKNRKRKRRFLAYAREVGIIKEANFPPVPADWAKGFMEITPSSWVSFIPPRPLLIIHAEDDEVVRVYHAQELYRRVQGQADFLILHQAGHRVRLHEAAMQEALIWAQKIVFSAQK